MERKWARGLMALGVTLAAVHCGSSGGASGGDAGTAPPPQSPPPLTGSLITCPYGRNDCIKHQPGCSTGTPSCSGTGFCSYNATAGSLCLPPDVAFCDYGGHPECNRIDGFYPPDVSACGVAECVVDAGTCVWGKCVPPTGH